MENRGHENLAFSKALQAKGWHLEDDFLYSPNGGQFKLGGSTELPRHIVERMYEKMKDTLDKMPESEHLYRDKEQFHNWVKDMESLVSTLKELLDR